MRLERELARAFGAHPIPGDMVERLVRELAAVDAELWRESQRKDVALGQAG